MTTLNPLQIAQVAYNAGFRGQALNEAVAVALAESGGNPIAYNPEAAAGTKAGSGSRGLWQIYGGAHPEYNNNSVFNPQANANAAYKVFLQAGGRFTPWSTYNQGLARPTLDFSSLFKGTSAATNQTPQQPTASAQQVTVKQSNTTPAVSTWQDLLALPSTLPATIQSNVTSGIQSGATQTVKALFPGTKEDYTFIITGYSLIVLGIIFLMVAAFRSDTGQAITSTAIKAAAI